MKNKNLVLLLFILIAISSCSTSKNANISKISDDENYGYIEKKPIKVGGLADSGPLSERVYLDKLRGPNGEKILYTRLGSCCQFKTSNSPFGGGMLDKYEVTYRGLGKTVVLYLNMYDPADKTLKAPVGFKME